MNNSIYQKISGSKILHVLLVLVFCIIVAQIFSWILPSYVFPSPLAVFMAFIDQFWLIVNHAAHTLLVAVLGLLIAVLLSLIFTVLMDSLRIFYVFFYPLALISQAIPLISIAPLFILWFGFGIFPKILAVVLVCFFPILINLIKSFQSLDKDYIDVMKSMGASRWQMFRHVKLPGSAPSFFAGLQIAAAYSVMGAVIGEWLGGTEGLGVYLIRSQKSFATSRLFAAILTIIVLSLVLFFCVKLCERLLLPKNYITSIDLGNGDLPT